MLNWLALASVGKDLGAESENKLERLWFRCSPAHFRGASSAQPLAHGPQRTCHGLKTFQAPA